MLLSIGIAVLVVICYSEAKASVEYSKHWDRRNGEKK